jgi:oligopeptide transport system substrate-binding protein
MVLERNPHYRDAAHVAIDRVEYYPIEDQDEELKRYRADELDLTASVPHEQLDFIKTNLAAEYRVSPVLGIAYVGFNLERPPFKDDLRLREALSLAVDRQVLTEKIVRGGALPAYGWIPPGIEGYPDPQPDWAAETQAERNERARADYRAVGWSSRSPACGARCWVSRPSSRTRSSAPTSPRCGSGRRQRRFPAASIPITPTRCRSCIS